MSRRRFQRRRSKNDCLYQEPTSLLEEKKERLPSALPECTPRNTARNNTKDFFFFFLRWLMSPCSFSNDARGRGMRFNIENMIRYAKTKNSGRHGHQDNVRDNGSEQLRQCCDDHHCEQTSCQQQIFSRMSFFAVHGNHHKYHPYIHGSYQPISPQFRRCPCEGYPIPHMHNSKTNNYPTASTHNFPGKIRIRAVQIADTQFTAKVQANAGVFAQISDLLLTPTTPLPLSSHLLSLFLLSHTLHVRLSFSL